VSSTRLNNSCYHINITNCYQHAPHTSIRHRHFAGLQQSIRHCAAFHSSGEDSPAWHPGQSVQLVRWLLHWTRPPHLV